MNIKNHFPVLKKFILIGVGAIRLIYGILTTPYSPCHDSLELHKILNLMLNKESIDVFYQTYLNFWLNNKLTVFCYFPAVSLFNSVETGVRIANSLFLISTVFFTAYTINKISEKCDFSFMFFLTAFLAPFMLLTGPYIYLPSLFLASASMLCLTLHKKIGYVLFFACTSLLFILRPTCLGFIMAFITITAFLNIKNKRYFLTRLLTVTLIFICSFGCKTAIGQILYKSGLHPYPRMQSSAMLWTFELGTRSDGYDTGSCTYTPFALPDASDTIQKNFHRLWMYYYNDVFYGTSSYNNIKSLHKEIRSQIIERTRKMKFADLLKNTYYKTARFYYNSYIPYYYKANINDKSMKIWKNYDDRYFVYMNTMLILFFLALILNAISIFKNRRLKNKFAAACALSAISVNIMMILLTEVSKKYMFDFFLPMCLYILLTCNYYSRVHKNICPIAAVTAIISVVIAVNTSNIDIFTYADTRLIVNQNICTYEINMRRKCTETGYYIENYDGTVIELYGKQTVILTFPQDCFDAFILHMPDGKLKRFSSQSI